MPAAPPELELPSDGEGNSDGPSWLLALAPQPRSLFHMNFDLTPDISTFGLWPFWHLLNKLWFLLF